MIWWYLVDWVELHWFNEVLLKVAEVLALEGARVLHFVLAEKFATEIESAQTKNDRIKAHGIAPLQDHRLDSAKTTSKVDHTLLKEADLSSRLRSTY